MILVEEHRKNIGKIMGQIDGPKGFVGLLPAFFWPAIEPLQVVGYDKQHLSEVINDRR